MLRSACLIALALLGWSAQAHADWDDRPGVGFNGSYLISTPDAPCGTGTPPRGHFPPDLPTSGPFQALKLTVKQDPNRLCYVFGRLAEAPTIRVRQDDDLIVVLENDITDPSALDKIVAPGKLDTPNPKVPTKAGFYPVVPAMHHQATGATNLHLHGFAVPPTVPQDEVLKTCVDPETGPANCGQRRFTYHYHIPLTMPAGLYWYHPHVHGEVQAQMLMGLSGALIVEGPDDDARRNAGIFDRVFVFRQSTDLDAQNQAASVPSAPVHAATVEPEAAKARKEPPSLGGRIETAHELACSDKTGTDELTMNGALVKDGDATDADLAALEIPAGHKQFWRIVNAATDAFLDLALVDQGGKPVPVEVVARDGAPLSDDTGKELPPQATTEAQLVPPSGRIEFLVTAPAPGKKIYFVSHGVDTGCAGDKVPERKLAYLSVTRTALENVPTEVLTPPAAPKQGPFTGLLARKTDRERTIAFAEYPHPGSDDLNDFYIVERKPGAVLRPFEMDGPPAITVKSGTTEEWTVENWTNELHAFHIHQVHFRVLDVNGRPVPETPLLDVVTVPAASPADVATAKGVVPGRVRVKLYFPAELAGDIPFHCHLVDHEDAGMMAVLRVLPPEGETPEKKAEMSPVKWASLLDPPICRSPRASSGSDVSDSQER
ncbi:MAG TPA: multicopper oxidase domain-containing protein [Aliidongia sp.]|nr:multicopper oxidase domain-containing protein [Aliidongia sp.]